MFTKLLLQSLPTVDTTQINDFTERIDEFKHMSFRQAMSTLTHDATVVLVKVAIALVILFIGRWLIRKLVQLMDKIFEKRKIDPSLRTFLRSMINVTLYVFLILTIVGSIGLNITSFIAILASLGLAIGMALSGTLQNFAGGVIILLFRPFRVGDYIIAQGQEGTVKDIQLFNTMINTADNKRIVIPNGPLSTGIINNTSRERNRRVEWVFSIAYGNDYDLAKNTIAKLLDEDKRILDTPAYYIAVKSLAANSVDIIVQAWVKKENFWNVFYELNEKVYKIFIKIPGLEIPFPQLDVHLYPETEEAPPTSPSVSKKGR